MSFLVSTKVILFINSLVLPYLIGEICCLAEAVESLWLMPLLASPTDITVFVGFLGFAGPLLAFSGPFSRPLSAQSHLVEG